MTNLIHTFLLNAFFFSLLDLFHQGLLPLLLELLLEELVLLLLYLNFFGGHVGHLFSLATAFSNKFYY